MNNGCFKKGNIPWNKGLKGFNPSPKTNFTSERLYKDKHPSWKGGVQYNVKDGAYVWIEPNKRMRRSKLVYEKEYGVGSTEGKIVYHLDGNKWNDEISNLELIDRAELLRRNLENKKMKKEIK
jgi:hypothetical protein